MDSLFGRKKSRPQRQPSLSVQDLEGRSVPYDKLAPSPRSPTTVGTVSQGLRGAPNISAPITNPTLTANGTEFNKFAMQRSKVDRDRAYDDHNNGRSSSPRPSMSSSVTPDAPQLYNENLAWQLATGRPKGAAQSIRRSEASSSSKGSPTTADFGQIPNSPPLPPLPNSPVLNANSTLRPQSAMTTRSESSRGSRYAPSVTTTEPHHSSSHLAHHFYHHNRHGNADDFYFPRPDDDSTIEALFENVKRTRDLGEMPNLSIDQKWHMVYNDEHIRWKEERTRDEQARKQTEAGAPASIVENTPEWYIKKFLDKTITSKQASSLQVSLRSKELRYDLIRVTRREIKSSAAGSGISSRYKGRLCWRRLLCT